MRLALDTDVVAAAPRSPAGVSAALSRASRRGEITLLASVALALAYAATCLPAEHRLAAGLSAREVMAFAGAVIVMAEPVESHFLWRQQLRDPADELVLEAAVNRPAEAIVTLNARDFGAAPERFRLTLLAPAEAMRRIRK